MSSHLNLSVNELRALLTRSFEALYGHERDYYDMARTVLWLECRGHEGVAQLVERLPKLGMDHIKTLIVDTPAPGSILVDGHGQSLFCIGRSIADLTMAEAAIYGTAKTDIQNVENPDVLIGLLPFIASQGFNAQAFCCGKQAIIAAGNSNPDIYETDNRGASLSINADREKMTEIYMSAGTQKSNYAKALDNGIQIERTHYDALTKVADRVLVEASEASRRGAGE